jgi:hypothetical protein
MGRAAKVMTSAMIAPEGTRKAIAIRRGFSVAQCPAAMTSRLRRILTQLVELSPEVVARFPNLRTGLGDRRRVCRNADLILGDLTPDPALADDIEAGVRERRARAEDRNSPWER